MMSLSEIERVGFSVHAVASRFAEKNFTVVLKAQQ